MKSSKPINDKAFAFYTCYLLELKLGSHSLLAFFFHRIFYVFMPVYVVTYFYVPLSYKTKCRLTRSDETDNGYERERE